MITGPSRSPPPADWLDPEDSEPLGTTLSSSQGRLRLPPEAVRAEGPPEGAAVPLNQSREAHHSARPHHSPEGGQSAAVFAADWPHEGA
jgi:hypothetical protein